MCSANNVGALANGAVEVVLNKMSGGCDEIRTYSSREIDAVLVYVAEIDKILWLPVSICDGKNSVSVRVYPAANNQKKHVLSLKDFVW